jgi:hypothetical protein
MQILVCKIPKIETRDPFHNVRVRVYKNKKMKLKNFRSAISIALNILILKVMAILMPLDTFLSPTS